MKTPHDRGEERAPLRVYTEVPYTDESEISLYDIWRVLSRYRLLLLGVTLLAAFLSGLAGLLMTPMYRAEVLLAPVTESDEGSRLSSLRGFGDIAALAGVNVNRQGRKSESIATLISRKFSDQFIKDNEMERVLFADLWDEKKQDWAVTDEEDIPTSWDIYALFDKNVRGIREDRDTGLVTLSIEWSDPDTAAQWANELVSSVNATLSRQAVEVSNQAIAYLKEQLARTSVVELKQVLHRLIEVEMKKLLIANINQEYAFRVIDPAVAPEDPFKPRVSLMVILSTILGLMFGVILALILNVTRGRTASAEKNNAGVENDAGAA